MGAGKIIVIAGVGSGGGTGGAVAYRFARAGYKVALLARRAESLIKLSKEISKDTGASAAAFPLSSYSHNEVSKAFNAIKKEWPDDSIRITVWNAGDGIWKSFLDVTDDDLDRTTSGTVFGPFAFARESILTFKDQDLDDRGARGTIIFTGATAALRGNVTTSAFAAGKFALRALSQSLSKEFGKQNIHVAHAVIDGSIATDRNTENPDDTDPNTKLVPDAIAEAYEFLAHQHRSAWTWELDLRPAHEKW